MSECGVDVTLVVGDAYRSLFKCSAGGRAHKRLGVGVWILIYVHII